MCEGIANTLFQEPADIANHLRSEIAAHYVSTQRQWQARFLLPPDSQIDHQVQPLVLKRELAFVDNQPSFKSSRGHGRNDLVARDDFVLDSDRQEKPLG